MAFLPSITRRTIDRFSINTTSLTSFFNSVELNPRGENWPVVYLLHNDHYVGTPGASPQKLLYVGESTSAVRRMKEHFSLTNPFFADRAKLNVAHIIFDDSFNKSAILDIEQELIHMFGADSSNYTLQNRNYGQSTQHQYYERDQYMTSLRQIWDELRQTPINMAVDSFEDVRNSNLFKYSPFTALTDEQKKVYNKIVDALIDSLENKTNFNAIIEGCAGTGKTVVLIKVLSELAYLAKCATSTPTAGSSSSSSSSTPSPSSVAGVGNLAIPEFDSEEDAEAWRQWQSVTNARVAKIRKACPTGLKIAYVVPLSELLKPFQKVIRAVCGDPSIVKCASEVANDPGRFDVIFVDEAHRLGTVNKFGANKDPYKKACLNALGITYVPKMPNPPTELDWILSKTNNCVFVYDKDQKVRSHPSITHDTFNKLVLSKPFTTVYTLTKQMRCKAGDQYVRFLKDFFNNNINSGTPLPPWKGYDFRVYDDVDQMVADINSYNAPTNCGLSRVVAGYGWKWVTMGKKRTAIKAMPKSSWDIRIGKYNYFWNEQNGNFIFNADRDEIGCVHTVQGFDMNYVGIIIGPELGYDATKGFYINEDRLYDSGVRNRDKAELLEMTLRAYKVMMERGIRGCYVYACDPDLQNYLKKHLPSVSDAVRNLDMLIDGCINKLTGINVTSGGREIKDEIVLKKTDLDRIIDSQGLAGSIDTICVDGKDYFVEGVSVSVSVSEDGEYYVFKVKDSIPIPDVQ